MIHFTSQVEATTSQQSGMPLMLMMNSTLPAQLMTIDAKEDGVKVDNDEDDICRNHVSL